MQVNTRLHKPHIGVRWEPANVALTILVMLVFLIFLFLFLSLTAPAAQGRNSAPRTAVQAAAVRCPTSSAGK